MQRRYLGGRITRRFFLLGIATTTTLLSAACGSGTSPTPSPTPVGPASPSQPSPTLAPGSSSTATATAPSASNTAVQPSPVHPSATAVATAGSIRGQQAVLWGIQYEPHVERYHMLADAFTKRTGATLQVEPQAGDLGKKLIAAVAAKTAPDASVMHGAGLLPLYFRQVMVDVSQLFRDWGIDPKAKFAGDSIDEWTYGHKIWGVPVEVNLDGNTIGVPTDEVDKVGLSSSTPPFNGRDFFDSFDHLWQTAKTLQEKLGTTGGRVSRWGLYTSGWEAHSLFGIIRSQGVSWWDEDAKKFNINSDAGITAFKLLLEKPVSLGIEAELSDTDINAAVAGKVFLTYGNDTVAGEAAKIGRRYVLAMAPPVKGSVTDNDPLFIGEGGWGFIAFSAAKNRDVAIEFLHFMASTEAQTIYAGIYGGIPSAWREINGPDNPRWGKKDDPVIQSWIRYAKYLDRTIFFGHGFGYFSDVTTYAHQVSSDVRQKKKTAEQAAQQLQQLCEKQYQRYLEEVKQFGIEA